MCPKHNSQFSLFSSFNSILAFPMIPSISQIVKTASLCNQIFIPMIFHGFQKGYTAQTLQLAHKLAHKLAIYPHPILMNPSKQHHKSNPPIKTFRLETQNQWKLMKKQANTKQQDSWQCYKQTMKILPLNPVYILMIGQQHLLKIKKSFLPSIPRIGIIVLVTFLHHPSAESLRSLQISILQHANHA